MQTQQTIDTTASPVVQQETGIALFDLKVSATPLVITFDVDALNSAIDAVLEDYADLVVTEDMVTGIKSEMAALNKIKDRVESARKDISNTISAPVKEFESQVKAAVQRIVAARAKLDEQVKDFEQRDREGRRAAVQLIIDAAKQTTKCQDIQIPIDERWLNKSAKPKTTQAEVENIILKHQQEQAHAALMERAKQDRVDAVGKEIRTQSALFGFDLPLSRFMDCMELNQPMDEVITIVGSTFAAEKELRDKQEALRAQQPAAQTRPSGPAVRLLPPPPPLSAPTVQHAPQAQAVEVVTITKDEYDYLVGRDNFLSRLEAAGVDSWEGYDNA